MRRLGTAVVALSLFAGCGGLEVEPSSDTLAQQQAPLTTTDVDVAPECAGILSFVNTASFQTLDKYLPSNLVTHLVNRRTTSPFVSLADIDSVPLMGPTRFKQIEQGARQEKRIGASCVGILDTLAVSTDDAAALVSLVNSISDSELHDVLPYSWNGAVNLLNLRPFTSVQAISDTDDIGTVSLRNLRNAATLSRPFEALAAAVSSVPGNGSYGGRMARHFDWWQVVTDRYYTFGGLECFGLEPSSVPYGATVRPYLADAAEVRAEVVSTIKYVDRNGTKIPSSVVSAGLANLDARIAGRSFKGCTFGYANDPWSGHSVSIFVDTENGFSVLTDTYWAE
ncbi:MAG: hypothetical protein ABW123_10390 [Cystobacter sp.]